MATDGTANASSRFAVFQVLGRVFQHLNSENLQSLLLAIAHRPDSLEKIHRFQALETICRTVQETAVKYERPEAASWANLWAVGARSAARAAWKRLYGESAPPMPPAEQLDSTVLLDFMNDAELMRLLGLEVGWTPDLKRADKELDGLG